MTLSLPEVASLVAAAGSGLVAGLCFAFASFLVRAFDRLGASQAVRAMQAINATILRSSAMPVWWGTAVAGLVAAACVEERSLAVAALASYAVGALGITRLQNLPLNEELDRVDPDAPGAEEAWRRYRLLWGRWNALRTVACALASAGFALGA